MDRKILDLFHQYRHKPIPRRMFIERLAELAGGTAAAMALLPLLEGDEAMAAVVPADDPRLETATVRYRSALGEVSAYQARPKGAGPLPGVVVIHENRGLNEHIRDVTRRAGLAGYHALAPDLLSRKGGTSPVQIDAIRAIGRLTRANVVTDLTGAVDFLRGSSLVAAGQVGAVGFCWGGGMSLRLATASPELTAAVVFYGPNPPLKDVPKIAAPLLLLYAGNDAPITPRVPRLTAALDRAGKQYTVKVYPDTEHAFHNDTSPARYNAEAARDAWARTLVFFGEHLRG